MCDVKVLNCTSEEPGFWSRMGPFFASPEVRKELGGPMSDGVGYRWFLALAGQDVAGFAAVTVRGAQAELKHLYVVPAHRGKGIGLMLLRERIGWCDGRGIKVIRTTTYGRNADQVSRLGFLERARRGRYITYERRMV